MTCKLTGKNRALRVASSCVAILTILAALVALAQVTDAGQPSAKPSEEFDGLATDSGPLLFLPAAGYDSGGYTATSIAVADLNGDGKLDLVVGNRCADSGCAGGHSSVSVLLGNGDGTFQTAVSYDSAGHRTF